MKANLMMFDEKPLKQRIYKVYDAMLQKAKPRLWKTGSRKGRIRVPGLAALPFTKEQLWQHALKQVGTGVMRCPYCVDIGRPAALLDLTNIVFDHRFPQARAGAEMTLEQVWSLSNLVCVCSDCNNLKGKLSYHFFIGIMSAIEIHTFKYANGDTRDRDAIYACLRTHGIILRNFGKKPDKAIPAPDVIPINQQSLALREDW